MDKKTMQNITEASAAKWKRLHELEAENARLREALGEVASGPCCQTDGCSVEDPHCDTMIARAALQETTSDT